MVDVRLSQAVPAASANQMRCRYCQRLNKVKPEMLGKIKVRCGYCKLLLANQPHIKFRYLDPGVYLHPIDSQAQTALRRVPGVEGALKRAQDLNIDAFYQVFFSANGLRVSEQMYPELFAKLQIAAHTLSMNKLPALFVSEIGMNGPLHAPMTVGLEQPLIVLPPHLLQLEEVEQLTLLAQQLGHIHCEHLPLKLLADLVLMGGAVLKKTPLASLSDMLSLPAQMALLTWRQKALFSTDRSGLLVTQSEMVMAHLMMYESGGRNITRAGLEQFVRQARLLERKSVQSWVERYWGVLSSGVEPPTFPLWRLAELLDWVEQSRGYREILRVFGD